MELIRLGRIPLREYVCMRSRVRRKERRMLRTVYFMEKKSEVLEHFKSFVKFVKKDTDCDIDVLRSDNGTEYTNAEMKVFLADNAIRHQTSVPYTPEQNGSAEREMRTIVEAARSMIYSKDLSRKLWAEAVNTAVYVINRTGTSTIKGKTPYELWFNKQPIVNDFKVFGVDVYIHVPKQLRRKWDAKSQKGFFVGYSEKSKGYRVFNQDKNRIEEVRDVIFNQINEKAIVEINNSNEPNNSNHESDSDESIASNDTVINVNNSVVSTNSRNQSIISVSDTSYESADDDNQIFRDEHAKDLWCDHNLNNVLNSRLRQRNLICAEGKISAMALMANASQQVNDEPNDYDAAIKSANKEMWIEAMQDEYNSLKKNNVFI